MRLARGLLLLLVLSVALVIIVDLVQPVDQRGGHSARLVVGVVAAIALLQIGSAVLRTSGDIWAVRPPSWPRRRTPTASPTLPAIAELEALIISATTGGARARDRLDRRLEAAGCETLAEHLPGPDPSSREVTDTIELILARRTDRTEGSHVT